MPLFILHASSCTQVIVSLFSCLSTQRCFLDCVLDKTKTSLLYRSMVSNLLTPLYKRTQRTNASAREFSGPSGYSATQISTQNLEESKFESASSNFVFTDISLDPVDLSCRRDNSDADISTVRLHMSPLASKADPLPEETISVARLLSSDIDESMPLVSVENLPLDADSTTTSSPLPVSHACQHPCIISPLKAPEIDSCCVHSLPPLIMSPVFSRFNVSFLSKDAKITDNLIGRTAHLRFLEDRRWICMFLDLYFRSFS
jgi:hypothetical protein